MDWENVNSSNDGPSNVVLPTMVRQMLVRLMSVSLMDGMPSLSVRLMTKTLNVGISHIIWGFWLGQVRLAINALLVKG